MVSLRPSLSLLALVGQSQTKHRDLRAETNYTALFLLVFTKKKLIQIPSLLQSHLYHWGPWEQPVPWDSSFQCCPWGLDVATPHV